MIPWEFALGVASGLIGAAVLYLGLRWWARRVAASDPPPPGAQWETATPIGTPSLPAVGTAPPAFEAGSADASTVPPPLLGAVRSEPLPGGSSNQPRAGRGIGPPEGTVRLSQRVILHVYAQGTLPPGSVAPLGLCQAGIGEALGLPQNGLAAVLRRLEAAEILRTERGHVRGRDRRLKIYRLTSRGEAVARELRMRSHQLGNGDVVPRDRRP